MGRNPLEEFQHEMDFVEDVELPSIWNNVAPKEIDSYVKRTRNRQQKADEKRRKKLFK